MSVVGVPLGLGLLIYLYPSKDSHFKAFGPQDGIIPGFWALLRVRVMDHWTLGFTGL